MAEPEDGSDDTAPTPTMPRIIAWLSLGLMAITILLMIFAVIAVLSAPGS